MPTPPPTPHHTAPHRTAPLEMFETAIQFRPKAEWREGMTAGKPVDGVGSALAEQLSGGRTIDVDVRREAAAPMLRSENARLVGFVYVDVRGRDLKSAVKDLQAAVAQQAVLPPGYAVSWSGQFEYLQRGTARPKRVVPLLSMLVVPAAYRPMRRPRSRRPKS